MNTTVKLETGRKEESISVPVKNGDSAEVVNLKAQNAIQAQRIRHLEEEVNRLLLEYGNQVKLNGTLIKETERLKKALRIADEAVNIATDSGVY